MPQSPARLRRREQEARERESQALELYAQGRPAAEIAARVGCTPNYVSTLVSRALERRAASEGPTVEAAKQAYLLRVETMVQAYMPMVLGGGTDGDGNTMQPDVRAGELVLKLLDRTLAVQSAGAAAAIAAQTEKRIDVYHHVENGQDIRAQIMDQLAEVRQHMGVVEGELVEAGTELDALRGGRELADSPAAPPDWQPPEQEEEEPDEG